MNGLLYKEFKQNRVGLLVTMLVPFLVVLLPIVLTLGDVAESLTAAFVSFENNAAILKLLFILVTYLLVGDMQGKTLLGDDTKKWGIFVASSPSGVQGYLYTKYVFIFGMCGLMYVASTIADFLYSTVGYQVTKQEIGSGSAVFVLLFYAQLLLRALELPFFIRFGMKRGSTIKIIMRLLLVIVFVLLVIVNPFDIITNIVGAIDSLRGGEVSDTITLLIAIFPFLALGAYYLSYRISCKWYMKGVEQYDQ